MQTATALIRVQAARRGLPLKPADLARAPREARDHGAGSPSRSGKRAWPPFGATRFRCSALP